MKKKILIISTVGLIYDGITSVIVSYLEAMDLSEMEIFVAGTVEVKESFRKRIEKLNCKVIDFPNRKKNPLAYIIELTKFIKNNGIDVVHAHGNSGTLAIEMLAAWIGGCEKRIAHSHNTQCNQKKADRFLRPLFNVLYTDALACGTAAGHWLFPRRKFTVMTNGRNIDEYKFDSSKRKQMRDREGLKDEIVIGHVGGFFEQKNHKFLVEVYKEIKKNEPNTKFYMIGDGPLKKEIENLCVGLDVVFTGSIDNISDYLNMMDGVIFPSFFEGLPLVVIEWQINGLPCVISDVITQECKLTDTVELKSIKDSPQKWAIQILKMVQEKNRLTDARIGAEIIMRSEFNIVKSAQYLRQIYLN